MNDGTRARGPGSGKRGSPTSADACIVPPGDDDDPVAAKLWRLRDRYGYLTRAELGERPPGRPSSYSLPPDRLAAHVRGLRRSGWQGWEVRARFEFGDAA